MKLWHLTLLVLSSSTASHSLQAAQGGSWGVGIALINPTGLSTQYNYAPYDAVAAAIGWGSHSFQLHLDHQWLRHKPFIIDKISLQPYFGLGLRLEELDHRYKDDELNLGLRVPLGVSYRWEQLQAFGEISPALNLIEESSFIVDLTLGGRFYF